MHPRTIGGFSFLLTSCMVLSAAAADKNVAVTDVAKADADFAVQGEYVGQVSGQDGKPLEYGVQVIALGGAKFRAAAYRGGLPGDGWDQSDKIVAEGQTADGVTTFSGSFGTATIKDAVITIADVDGKALGEFRRVVRESPTLGAKPPEGAVVLFDGSTNAFEPGKTTEDGLLMVPQRSKHVFAKDFTLHLEFRTPYRPYARGQGRGNSGAYLQGRYEIQVLDSFGLEGKKNECGAVYGRHAPTVNMCFPPLSWQTFDVDLRVSRFDRDGKATSPAVVTVRHNGVVIHDQVKLGGRRRSGGPLTLQNHGNPVHYRNIWLVERELDSDAARSADAKQGN